MFHKEAYEHIFGLLCNADSRGFRLQTSGRNTLPFYYSFFAVMQHSFTKWGLYICIDLDIAHTGSWLFEHNKDLCIVLLCIFFFSILLSMQKWIFFKILAQYFSGRSKLTSPPPSTVFLSFIPPFDFELLTRIQMPSLLLKCIIKKKKRHLFQSHSYSWGCDWLEAVSPE